MNRLRSAEWMAVLAVLLALASCSPGPSTPPPTGVQEAPPTAEPLTIEDGVLYVALIWHQHQPVYGIDPETGAYVRPWVRVHATKDYLDMATIVSQYPGVHVTFNITPSLILQLDDLAAGTRDLYWLLSEIDAADLTESQKRFVLERFFDTNPRIIERFPRYRELARMRGGSDPAHIEEALAGWTAQDFRDLQVLFNLAWTDPDWLAQDPLASLVDKGSGYTETDKDLVFAEHERLVREVIPTLARMQQEGQIEITTTPFAHPILPLLVDSNLARQAMPEADLPPRFAHGEDAVAQVDLGVRMYQEHFGIAPRGLWPAEGSVAPVIISMIANAGIQWIASDEGVLAHSLPEMDGFTRDGADTVLQADGLYRPYTVEGTRGEVAILFRDRLLSDKIGFEYSGLSGEQAAADLLQRLNRIQSQLEAEGAPGPHLVTILLDGENAWEYYENDGKDFLHALYQGLSEAEGLRTVTPSEYLAVTEAPRRIENLWAGSWINHDFSTWIGEDEENLAWTYLAQTRDDLAAALREEEIQGEDADEALRMMYFAEGSDWFWWYGADQNSGVDSSFDEQFRTYLERVYALMGKQPPDFVRVPIVAQEPQPPQQEPLDMLAVNLDGRASAGEWDAAGFYTFADPANPFGLYFGFDPETLFLRVDAAEGFSDRTALGFYMNLPVDGPANAYSRYGRDATLLGFGARRLLEITFEEGEPVARVYAADGSGGWDPISDAAAPARAALQADLLEVAAPLAGLAPSLGGGDRIHLRLIVSDDQSDAAALPIAGPALLVTPDLPLPNVVLAVEDPVGDDHGPGSYTYPTDGVFVPGVFDLTRLLVGSDEESVIFRLTLDGPINNHWGSPNGLSAQTLDIYVDVNGAGSGDRVLLPGRNAALTPDFAWDFAIWVEGWTPGIFRPSPEGPVAVDADLEVVTNPGQRRVTISVPRAVLPGDPASWSIAVVMLGQEGFPAAGVWRVRDVNPLAEQWRFGGGPSDANHTRILDVLWPEGSDPTQEELLGAYPSSSEAVGSLGADDLPQVPMIRVAEAD